MGRLGRLSRDQLDFVAVFLTARGKIKDVESALGISYPTVVSRLEQVVAALGASASANKPAPISTDAEDVLDALARGELTTEQAAARLRPERPGADKPNKRNR